VADQDPQAHAISINELRPDRSLPLYYIHAKNDRRLTLTGGCLDQHGVADPRHLDRGVTDHRTHLGRPLLYVRGDTLREARAVGMGTWATNSPRCRNPGSLPGGLSGPRRRCIRTIAALVCLRWRSGRYPRPREDRVHPEIVRHSSRDMNSFLARCSGRRAPTARAQKARPGKELI
jgi:hypothetical protein